MTEQLRDLTARIAGIRQLGAVVNAMRGIAGNRAQQARGALAAVDAYSATLGRAIGRALALMPGPAGHGAGPGATALVLFTAEQGFAGAFSERVLGAAGDTGANALTIVVGTRGAAIAPERGIVPDWSVPMVSHTEGIPRLADRVAGTLFARIAEGHVARIEAIFTTVAEHRFELVRLPLLPLDERLFPPSADASPPLLNIPAAGLLDRLAADYVHAQLCHAALHAFAAENEARMQSMASAHREIDRRLDGLAERARIVRQEEITAEIIELSAGIRAVADQGPRQVG